MVSTVSSIGFYHGGDVLYQLRDAPRYTWHDACLRVPGEVTSTTEEMDSATGLDLVTISEPRANSLRLIIAELTSSERSDSIEHGVRDRLYEVTWSAYVAYNVINERYCTRNDSDEFEGRLFRLYRKSRYLEFVRENKNATFLAPNHKHWAIICENHIIGVVSEEEPIIRRYGRAE
jgi:hypothetical protein